MSSQLVAISVDCVDAAALAQFWSAVLGRRIADGATTNDAVLLAGDQASDAPRIAFHRVRKSNITRTRLQLDLITDNLEAETLRLFGLGAEGLGEIERGGARWRVFVDIQGNEFHLGAG